MLAGHPHLCLGLTATPRASVHATWLNQPMQESRLSHVNGAGLDWNGTCSILVQHMVDIERQFAYS